MKKIFSHQEEKVAFLFEQYINNLEYGKSEKDLSEDAIINLKIEMRKQLENIVDYIEEYKLIKGEK